MGGALPVWVTVLDPVEAMRSILRIRLLAVVLGRLGAPFCDLIFGCRRSPPAGVALREVESFDERSTELWNKVRVHVRLAIDREATYLNWRFSASPRVYRKFIAEENGNLLGLVVTGTGEKFGKRLGYIAELIFDPDRLDVGSLLIRHARETLRSQGCGFGTALAFEEFKPVAKVLRQGGFLRLPRALMPHGIHFCFKDYSGRNAIPLLASSANWFVSWSDHDAV